MRRFTRSGRAALVALGLSLGAALPDAAQAEADLTAFELDRITAAEAGETVAALRTEVMAFADRVRAATVGHEPVSGLIRDECPQEHVLALAERGADVLALIPASPTPALLALQAEVDAALEGLRSGADGASSPEAAAILGEKAGALERRLIGIADVVRIASGQDAVIAAFARKTRDILVACLEVDDPAEVASLLPGIGDLDPAATGSVEAPVGIAPTAVVPMRLVCFGAPTVAHALEADGGDGTAICTDGDTHVVDAAHDRATLVLGCPESTGACRFRVEVEGGAFAAEPRGVRDREDDRSFFQRLLGATADPDRTIPLDEAVTGLFRRPDGAAISGTLTAGARLRVALTRTVGAPVIDHTTAIAEPKQSYFPGARITVADARLMLTTYRDVLANHAVEVEDMTRDGVPLSGLIGDLCAREQIDRLITDGRAALGLLADSPVPEIVDFAEGIRGGVAFLAARAASAPSPEGAAIYRWKREALEDQIVLVEDMEKRARSADALLSTYATKTRNVLVGCLETDPKRVDALLAQG